LKDILDYWLAALAEGGDSNGIKKVGSADR